MSEDEMGLTPEQSIAIEAEFRRYVERRAEGVKSLDAEEFEPNPLLLDALIGGLGFVTAEEVARFLINQRFERAAVTGLGVTLRNVARIVAGQTSDTNIAGVDIVLNRSDETCLIRVRSGPGINGDSARRTIDQLTQAAGSFEEPRLVLGFCYGTASDMNPAVRRMLEAASITPMGDEEFWSLLADGDGEILGEIHEIARRTTWHSQNIRQSLDAHVKALANALAPRLGMPV